MKNWHRNYFYESTGFAWIPPSPNLRTLKGSILYPGLEILQSAGVSVGRGTETPFEEFGAPWINGDEVAADLNARHLPGLRFTWPAVHSGRRTLRRAALRRRGRSRHRQASGAVDAHGHRDRHHPQEALSAPILIRRSFMFLVANAETIRQLQEGASPEQIVASWSNQLNDFDALRRKYFLYK